MTVFVACISSGKGTWIPVLRAAKAASWSKIYIVTTPYFKDKLPGFEAPTKVIVLDEQRPVQDLIDTLVKQFDFSFEGDVAVNLFSGTGKEHMAILAALLKTGCGLRFVASEDAGLSEL